MDSMYYGAVFPYMLSRFFNSTPDLQDEFLSLPEDTQQKILSHDIHSEQELRDYVYLCMEKA